MENGNLELKGQSEFGTKVVPCRFSMTDREYYGRTELSFIYELIISLQ